jgi:hypothetical protein
MTNAGYEKRSVSSSERGRNMHDGTPSGSFGKIRRMLRMREWIMEGGARRRRSRGKGELRNGSPLSGAATHHHQQQTEFSL